MKKIIKELEIYRLENKLSQTKLAEKLGVAFCTVNRWFNGRTNPGKIQEYHIKKILKNLRRKNYEKRKKESAYFRRH